MALGSLLPTILNRIKWPVVAAEPSDGLPFLCFAPSQRPSNRGRLHSRRIRIASKPIGFAATVEQSCGRLACGKSCERACGIAAHGIEAASDVERASQPRQILHVTWLVVPRNHRRITFELRSDENSNDSLKQIRRLLRDLHARNDRRQPVARNLQVIRGVIADGVQVAALLPQEQQVDVTGVRPKESRSTVLSRHPYPAVELNWAGPPAT